jgi:hypothetical protein
MHLQMPDALLAYAVGVSALTRHGFLRVHSQAGGEFVRLTKLGKTVSENYEGTLWDVDTEWTIRFGKASIDGLRQSLSDTHQPI